MPDNRPLSPRHTSTITRNNCAGFDFLADALKQPLGTLVALQVFEAVAFVAERFVQIGGPFCDADIGRLRVGVGVVREGEGGGVCRGAGDGGQERGVKVGVERRGRARNEDAGRGGDGEDGGCCGCCGVLAKDLDGVWKGTAYGSSWSRLVPRMRWWDCVVAAGHAG